MNLGRRFTVGPVGVHVTSNADAVLDYLGEFYPAGEDGHRFDWTVDAQVGSPNPATINPWGVSFQIDAKDRRFRLRAEDPTNLAITARKCVREVMVDFCERRHYTMLHASAVTDGTRTMIVIGDIVRASTRNRSVGTQHGLGELAAQVCA